MDNPDESASLAANAKTRPTDESKRTDIRDFAAENSVRIPYLRSSVSRIRQAPLSNRPGISARSQAKNTAARLPTPLKPESPPNPVRLRLEAK
jgi:hypothetical protein